MTPERVTMREAVLATLHITTGPHEVAVLIAHGRVVGIDGDIHSARQWLRGDAGRG
jgi:hypothetical protein